MQTYELLMAAARLRQRSVKAADYAGLQAVDNLFESNDAFVYRFKNDWLISTGNGIQYRIKRELVKPVVAGILDRMASADATTYHLPFIDRAWDSVLLKQVASAIRNRPMPVSAAAVGNLLESVEDLAN